LLRDDDDGAAKLLAEIERLRLFVRGTEDKAALLEKELQKERAQHIAKEKAALIGRIETKLQAREAAAAELETVLARANSLILEILNIGRQVDAAWPWANGDRNALLLFRNDVVAAVRHESYRISAIPRLGGGQKEGLDAGWHLPGSESPRFDLVHRPKSIPGLVSVLRNASTYASDIMRARRAPATAAPVVPVVAPEPRERTVAEAELAGLLRRQDELASLSSMSADQDNEYAANTIAIAKLTAQAEGAKPNA
jgi:hypothetical protein